MEKTTAALAARQVAYLVAVFGIVLGLAAILKGDAFIVWIHYWNIPFVVPTTFLGVLTAVLSSAILVALTTRGGNAEVTLDAGGVRWSRWRSRGYVPYANLRDASLEGGRFGGTILVLRLRDGEDLRLRLAPEEQPRAALSAILNRLAGREPAPGEPGPLFLERGGRDLVVWLASVREHVSSLGRTAYRQVALDLDALERLATDASVSVERRAAAVHAILVANKSVHNAHLTGGDSPPIVLVAAELASPGSIQSDRLDLALEHLPREDREAARAALAVRVRVAPPRARVTEESQEIDDEAEDVDDEDVRGLMLAKSRPSAP